MAIFTAIAGAISAVSTFIGGLGAVGSFILQSAVGIGLNLLAASMAGKEQEPSFSINGDMRGGGDIARSFIFGEYMTAGSLVWVNTWGSEGDTPNAWLTQVILLSDLPSKGLSGLIVDGKACTYGAGTATEMGYAIPEFNKDGANLYVKFYDGSQTIADNFLVSKAGTAARPYSGTRVGKGLTYVIVSSRSTKNMFSGFPSFQFVVDGTRLYDPSKDSTQPGGSGPQRWTDLSTWGGDGDELPAVQLYNVFRGISYNGAWLYGLQSLPAARLPVTNWIAAIQKCRVPIEAADGFEPTYRSSGEVDVSQPIMSLIEELLTTCQGRISEVGGTYSLFVGAPGAATVSITDGDILSTSEQSFTPFQGIADSVNGVSATYPSAKDNWNMQTAPPLLRPDLEVKDGNRRLLSSIELSFVPYDEQVQRLMKSALEEALRFRRHTITMPPWFWPYAVPGEIIEWTSERNGYIDKLMRIDGASDGANLDVLIDITEVDPSDYDWNSGEDFQPITEGDVGVIQVPPQVIIGWNVIPTSVRDNEGVDRRPAILLSWANNPATLLDVVGIRFSVRNKISGVIEYRGYTGNPEAGSIIYSQGLLPNTDYEVQGRYVVSSPRDVSDSGWLAVKTLDIRLTDSDVYLPGMIEGLEEFVGDATLWIRDGVRQTILEQERLARLEIDKDFSSYTERQEIRREAAVTEGESRAFFSEQIDVATGPNSSIARQLTQLGAEIGGKASSTALSALTVRVDVVEGVTTTQAGQITSLQSELAGKADASAVTLLTTRVTTVEGVAAANADAITSISAGQTGGDVATANFRMGVQAGPAGYASRIAMEARTGGTGTWRSAGFYMDVPASAGTPTRISLQADQISFTNGTTVSNPFIFEGSVLYLDEARIKMAKIDDLIVGTSNIEAGAVTIAETNSLAAGSWGGTNRDVSVTVNHGTGSPKVCILGSGGVTVGSNGSGSVAWSITARAGTTEINRIDADLPDNKKGGASMVAIHVPATGTASTTYTIRVICSSPLAAQLQTIVVQVLKR